VNVAPIHDKQPMVDWRAVRRAAIRVMRRRPGVVLLATGTTHRAVRSRAALRAHGTVV
jgi:hypothetical protein